MLRPFNKLCIGIGAVPSAFEDSMSWYEAIKYLVDYLTKEVIPAVNADTKLVNELKEYVEHYFDNLDVQEEINNKLDAMAESGQLQEIMAAYLDTRAVFSFDTLAELKAAENLKNGSYARTTGYYSKNDGGAGFYKIRTVTNQDVEDEGSIVRMADTNLVAELISDVACVNQFGTYGDASHDDTQAIKNAIAYAKETGKKLTSASDKDYLVNETLDMSNIYVDFSHSTISANGAFSVIKIDTQEYYGHIENITINANEKATNAIEIAEARKLEISNVDIIELTGVGILYTKGYEVTAHDINITGTVNSINSIGLDLHKGDSHWTDIVMIDMNIAIRTGGYLNYFTRIHAWILNYQNLANSKFFDVTGKCIAMLEQCYSDTYQYSIYQEAYEGAAVNPIISLNEFTVLFNQAIYSYEHYPHNPYIMHFQSNDDTQNIKMVNSYIQGNLATQITTGFVNTSDNFMYSTGNTFSRITRSSASSIKNLLSGLTPVTNEVRRNGNVVTINAMFSYDASVIGGGSKTIGTMEYFYRPETALNTVAYHNTSQWSGPNDEYETSYLYIDGTNIQCRFKAGTGTKYLHINVTYVINNN